MHAPRILATAVLAAALAGCGSGGIHVTAGTASNTRSAAPVSVPLSAAPTPADVCAQVKAYLDSTVRPTIDGWDVTSDEYDPRIATELHAEAFTLYRFAGRADVAGDAAAAIAREAQTLDLISVAIREGSDAGIESSASEATAALTQLEAACP